MMYSMTSSSTRSSVSGAWVGVSPKPYIMCLTRFYHQQKTSKPANAYSRLQIASCAWVALPEPGRQAPAPQSRHRPSRPAQHRLTSKIACDFHIRFLNRSPPWPTVRYKRASRTSTTLRMSAGGVVATSSRVRKRSFFHYIAFNFASNFSLSR